MISNINLESLKVFYEVAKEKNITRAAEKLFISQPAVTQTINKLESQLNTKLFIRHPKGISLTTAGVGVYNETAKALKHVSNINDVLFNENNLTTGEIVIGCGTILAKEFLVDPICNFLKQHPNIKFTIYDEPQKKLINKLLIGEVDIIISQKSSELKQPLTFTPITLENYILISGQSFNTNNITTLSHLNQIPFIVQNENTSSRSIFNEFVRKNNLVIPFVHEVSGYNMIMELCKNNIGIGLVPSYVANKLLQNNELKKINIETNLNTIELGYITNTSHNLKALQRFLTFM